jgi:hypothetical protein
MDTLEAFGDQVSFGLHRVSESRLVAVAWPLASVATGSPKVRLQGSKPVYARCAVDAIGVSKMMGRGRRRRDDS